MQGYDDQPSMEKALGKLASRSSRAKHKAWQGIQKSGGGSGYVCYQRLEGFLENCFCWQKEIDGSVAPESVGSVKFWRKVL